MKRELFLLLTVFFMSSLLAVDPYYPANYKNAFKANNISPEKLREGLFHLLDKAHIAIDGKDDVLAENCNGMGRECYRHKRLGYKQARKHIFGRLFLKKDTEGFKVKDVYCEKIFTDKDVKLGNGAIPDHTILNTEHTWPADRFTDKYPKSYQKSDLHHLFPTDQKANSTRSTREFADVFDGEPVSNCNRSHYSSFKPYFEPPAEHKGNVARAIFYFAVRYHGVINDREESTLRRWHELDPVDEPERIRNNIIAKIQGTRNPFIDYPELVHRIHNY